MYASYHGFPGSLGQGIMIPPWLQTPIIVQVSGTYPKQLSFYEDETTRV